MKMSMKKKILLKRCFVDQREYFFSLMRLWLSYTSLPESTDGHWGELLVKMILDTAHCFQDLLEVEDQDMRLCFIST
jgi:hypothetical protein